MELLSCSIRSSALDANFVMSIVHNVGGGGGGEARARAEDICRGPPAKPESGPDVLSWKPSSVIRFFISTTFFIYNLFAFNTVYTSLIWNEGWYLFNNRGHIIITRQEINPADAPMATDVKSKFRNCVRILHCGPLESMKEKIGTQCVHVSDICWLESDTMEW